MTSYYRDPIIPEPLSPVLRAPQSFAPARPKDGFYRRYGKRALDCFLILISLPVVLPLVLVLALLVMRDGSLPFYSQKRVGRGGRIYTMWKLRSMVPNAEARLEEHLAADPDARLEWDLTQKLKSDPRITRFGRFLRKSSADELPQLWNVLKGEMSLIGPRPMLPEQASLYHGEAYYMLRPGLTGLWQVSERNASAFSKRAYFDTLYEQSLTPLADLRIFIATFRVVLRGSGY